MVYDLKARAIRLVFNESFRRQLTVSLGKKTALKILYEGKRNYREIVKRSPSIGGWKNPLNVNVLGVAYVVAIYKAANGKLSAELIGKVFLNSFKQTDVLKLFYKFMSKKIFTRQWQDKRNILAVESQKKLYTADFVYKFVYGKTINEYGINYRECGICKLLKQENCSELAPQMCKPDYVTANLMGSELTRTKTIGNGDELCDFWFRKLRL